MADCNTVTFVQLQGSEKQIAWAEKIRAERLAYLKMMLTDIQEAIHAEPDAKSWVIGKTPERPYMPWGDPYAAYIKRQYAALFTQILTHLIESNSAAIWISFRDVRSQDFVDIARIAYLLRLNPDREISLNSEMRIKSQLDLLGITDSRIQTNYK